MNKQTLTENAASKPKTAEIPTSPINCLTGALIAGGLAIALYSLTASIAQTFAAKPLHSANPTVVNIGAAVRTLVVGVGMMATCVCGLIAIALVALAVQVFVQQLTQRSTPPSDVD
jgi:hypothetical protein